MQIKENKQLNIQQEQNYPGSVASYDTQPVNEVDLFYNGPEHHTGPVFDARKWTEINSVSGKTLDQSPPRELLQNAWYVE